MIISDLATCAAKRPFQTCDEAREHARRVRHVIGRVKPYRCPACKHWHVGHKRGWK